MALRLLPILALLLALAGNAAGQTLPPPIQLRGITLRPTTSEPLPQDAAAPPRLWMLQLTGPPRDASLERLRATGISIVSYLPQHAFVVWGDAAALAALDALVARADTVRWSGAYQPAYRLAPALRNASRSAAITHEVTIQLWTNPETPARLAQLRALGGSWLSEPFELLGFTTLAVRLPANTLETIAAWPDSFNIEPYARPMPQDESQGQIMAGNLSHNASLVRPAAPGYLAWLASHGFSTDPAAYPQIDFVDDGFDQGLITDVLHPDFYQFGDPGQPSRAVASANCTTDALGDSGRGHGNLNIGIAAGYSNGSAFPAIDGDGYQRGLGIAPYARFSATKIFGNSGTFDSSRCGNSFPGVVAQSLANGAALSSNSWVYPSITSYDTNAQTYDALTRDATATQAGNQEMLHVFAAGNYPSAVRSPATAKNVLSVGATEGVRDAGISDGCGRSEADNADDIAVFSGRGPTSDGRAKPDLVAPGTHIQGPASQSPNYSASGVCGTRYYPAGQTLYTWASGTSFAAPAVAGAAALAYEYYGRVLKPGQTPSPAMLKALLLSSTRYLSGTDSAGNLPGAAQGWGGLDMSILTAGTPRLLHDQQVVLGDAGATFVLTGSVTHNNQPLRITLAWTDAPGSPVAGENVLVNDLDLELTIGGTTYRGNHFIGAFSTAGGDADRFNNVEQISLPAGATGSFSLRVLGAAIRGDGIPGNADPTDQDFALVVANASQVQPQLEIEALHWRETMGNSNGAIDPGETLALEVVLANRGPVSASAISASLLSGSPTLTVTAGLAFYPTISSAMTATGSQPYTLFVGIEQPCGADVPFSQTLSAAEASFSTTFSLTVGSAVAGSERYRCEPFIPGATRQLFLPLISNKG